MIIRNLIIWLIISIISIINIGSDFDEYEKLENQNSPLIKKQDLPEDFSDKAYDTICDFIEKTRGLNYEWLIYFDYVTGDILKCVRGNEDSVELNFEDNEFKESKVASLHNHPENVLSPPSGKNFGILTRPFEDYELIAGLEYFWILKAKGVHHNLIEEMNNASKTAFFSSLLHCTTRYGAIEMINRMHDVRYGMELSKYINDKNIEDIQLIKRKYAMINDSNIAQYNCRKHITDPDTIRLLREFENSPYTPTGKEIMYNFYKSVGMDVDYNEIFAD